MCVKKQLGRLCLDDWFQEKGQNSLAKDSDMSFVESAFAAAPGHLAVVLEGVHSGHSGA